MSNRLTFQLVPLGFVAASIAMNFLADPLQDAPKPATSDKAAHQYIGTDKCKLCHMKKTTGEQFTIWKKSKHAKAFDRLATPEAKEIGKKQNIEDPQKSEKCLRCHVTGYGGKPEEFSATFKQKDGIGCETCHGAASDYYSEEVHAKSRELGVKAGLTIPDEKLCIKCHNKDSPNHKEFDFAKAKKEIDHSNPEKKK